MQLERWVEKKIVARGDLAALSKNLKKDGKSIVTINGAFDLLHKGHLHILFEAKRPGDILIVALNTDERIRSSKGVSRPINPLPDRLEMMASIEWVNFVTWFGEEDPRDLLRDISPDVHVNGSEYGPQCLEAQTLTDIGARLYIVDLLAGRSSTNIVKKMVPCG